MEMTRRNFIKSVGAASLAVAVAGLLGGCSEKDVVADARGLDDTANLEGIKMTVRSLSYGYDGSGTLYVVPEVLLNNGTAAGVPVSPEGGSFRLLVNGSQELNINQDTMAFLKRNKSWNSVESRTLNRGQYEKGHLCGSLQNGPDFNYVQVIFYPNPYDTKTYLRCRIDKSEANSIIVA